MPRGRNWRRNSLNYAGRRRFKICWRIRCARPAPRSRLRSSSCAGPRETGSHFVVTKPLAPIVVLERIIWIAREGRGFLLSDDYVGPDRRFARKDPPKNHPRRRREDMEAIRNMRSQRAPILLA